MKYGVKRFTFPIFFGGCSYVIEYAEFLPPTLGFSPVFYMEADYLIFVPFCQKKLPRGEAAFGICMILQGYGAV